jgi:hypothetical protein
MLVGVGSEGGMRGNTRKNRRMRRMGKGRMGGGRRDSLGGLGTRPMGLVPRERLKDQTVTGACLCRCPLRRSE